MKRGGSLSRPTLIDWIHNKISMAGLKSGELEKDPPVLFDLLTLFVNGASERAMSSTLGRRRTNENGQETFHGSTASIVGSRKREKS